MVGESIPDGDCNGYLIRIHKGYRSLPQRDATKSGLPCPVGSAEYDEEGLESLHGKLLSIDDKLQLMANL